MIKDPNKKNFSINSKIFKVRLSIYIIQKPYNTFTLS